jgi:hypothetical protein
MTHYSAHAEESDEEWLDRAKEYQKHASRQSNARQSDSGAGPSGSGAGPSGSGTPATVERSGTGARPKTKNKTFQKTPAVVEPIPAPSVSSNSSHRAALGKKKKKAKVRFKKQIQKNS